MESTSPCMRVCVSLSAPGVAPWRMQCRANDGTRSVTKCSLEASKHCSIATRVLRFPPKSSRPRIRNSTAVWSSADDTYGEVVSDDCTTYITSNETKNDPLTTALEYITEQGTPLALGCRGHENRNDDGDIRIAENVVYVCEGGVGADGEALLTVKGKKEYQKVMHRFVGVEDRELTQVSRVVLRANRISKTEAVIRWETTFVPEKVQWMVDLGNLLPNVTVCRYDILDKIGTRSRFTWRGLFILFKIVVREGEMRVPIAKIQGTSRLRFIVDDNGNKIKLTRHEDTLDLVNLVNQEAVQNRSITRHLLSFLDQRKPPGMRLEAWDERIDVRLKWRLVPGMGQFDIDGLEDSEDRSELYADAIVVLAFSTIVLLTFAWVVGGWYLTGLEHDKALQKMVQDYY